ncbi:MAG: DUF1109 family protein [Alphaproteobacteria bacterium]|nr:DUF1109 family protein [Alphaproteobacteria bacterium]
MREDTDRMIERLAREAAPVKALASPWVRAGAFLALVLVAMGTLAALGGHVAATFDAIASGPFAAELLGALVAGVSSVVAAVMLSIPGRSPNWFYLPLPGLALWLIGGAVGCYRQVAQLGYQPTSIFDSKDCFFFILSAGLPTAVAAYFLVRRSLSVDVMRVLALAGLGAALLAATLLQFVHAHGTNPVDFATHVVAVTLIALAAMASSGIESRRR